MAELVAPMEEAMLAFAGATDNNSMQAAQTLLKKLLNKKQASVALAAVLQNSTHEIARQLSGIFLRHRVVELWNRQNQEGREMVQNMLLMRLASESSRKVRKAIIGCIGVLLSAIIPNWPEVIVLLQRAMADDDEEVRELAVLLLVEITEQLGRRITTFVGPAHEVLAAGFTDSSHKVRVASLRAFSLVVTALDDEELQAPFEPFVEPTLELIYSCLGLIQDGGANGAGGGAGSSGGALLGAGGGGGAGANSSIAIDEGAAILAFEALGQLTDERSPIVGPHVEAIAQATLGVLAHSDLEISTRSAAAQVLQSCVRTRPKALAKKGLLEAALPVVFDLLTVFDPEEEAENQKEARDAGIVLVDYVDDSIWSVASRVLDEISNRVPERKIFSIVMEKALEWVSSESWECRRAAVMALGVIAEGCAGVMQENLEQVLTVVIGRVTDSDSNVRQACGQALALMSDHLIPRILYFHHVIVPAALSMLADDDVGVVTNGSFVLECFTDQMTHEIFMPYLQPLMEVVSVILSRADQPLQLQEQILMVIASAASSAGKEFAPYVPEIAPALLQVMNLTDEPMLRLRANATQCMGNVFLAAGYEAISPYFAEAVRIASFGLEFQDNTMIMESFFRFMLYVVQTAPNEDIVTIKLTGLVQLITEVCAGNDGAEFVRDNNGNDGLARAAEKIESGGNYYGDDDDDDDDDEEEEGDGEEDEEEEETEEGGDEDDDNEDDDDDDDAPRVSQGIKFTVSTAIQDVKSAAVDCLGWVVASNPHAVASELPRVSKLLRKLLLHFHPTVATSAAEALINLVKGYSILYPPILPQEEEGLMSLHPEMQEPYNQLVTELVLLIRNHSDRELVAHSCRTISVWCTQLGTIAVLSHADAVIKALLLVLKEEAECQKDEDGLAPNKNRRTAIANANAAATGGQNGDAEADEEEDHEHYLMDECTDALATVAGVLGPGMFGMYLAETVSELVRYTSPRRSMLDRVMAVGCFGELTSKLGPNGVAGATGLMIPCILKGLKSGHRGLQRNCCFCIGTLMQNASMSIQPMFLELMQGMQPLCNLERGVHGEDDEVLDNAISALCHAIINFPKSIPVEDAVPLILSKLPLVADFSESANVYCTLLALLTSERRSAAAFANATRIFELNLQALVPSSPTPDDKKQVIAESLVGYHTMLSGLQGEEGEQEKTAILEALQALPAELQTVYTSITSGDALASVAGVANNSSTSTSSGGAGNGAGAFIGAGGAGGQ